MKISLQVLLVVFFTNLFATIPTTRGLYVNEFIDVLGDASEEKKLLDFAYTNGFNYLILYQMSQVNDLYDITSPDGAEVLASFIYKAKSLYHFRIGVSSENPATFLDVFTKYQNNQTDDLKKIDVYYFEFEFWLDFRCEPEASSKYCERYLAPNGFPCDTLGGYQFFIRSLRYIDSLANAIGITSQTYIGQVDAVQACEIAHACDEILLHSYRTDDSDLYTYTRKRLAMLGDCGKRVSIIPIFHSGPDYMAPWLMNNLLQKPYRLYDTELDAETEPWASNIHLAGYHWYSWDDLKNKSVRPLPFIQLIAPTDTVTLSPQGNVVLKAEITQSNATLLSVHFMVYDSSGVLVFEGLAASSDSSYTLPFLPPHAGAYTWRVRAVNSRFVDYYSSPMHFVFTFENDALQFPDPVFLNSASTPTEIPTHIRIASLNGIMLFEGAPSTSDRIVLPVGVYLLYEQFPDRLEVRKIFVE